MSDKYEIKLFSGCANPHLAERIASELHNVLEPLQTSQFADGECNICIERSIRGADTFIIQPTCGGNGRSVNDNLVELLLLTHTLKLSSSKRITCIIPYFGYGRQDRKCKPRVPISASAVAQLIESMNPDRLVTVDLHASQIQGFFHRIPVDNLYADGVFVDWIRHKNNNAQLKLFPSEDLVVVSPDAGGVDRARRLADKLHASSVVTIIKRRLVANEVSYMEIIGEVQGKQCIIVDDIVDTAGTLCKAATLLHDKGAKEVLAFVSHGVLSPPAIDRLNNCSALKKLFITDSIPQEANLAKCHKLVAITIAPMLAEAIKRVHCEKSVSTLFFTNPPDTCCT
eukprot:GCRY01000503.1.p1 GENE.GCRY01000503.1~~GCRY01000503.1.p1  ORF type:complete len:341 (+),score=66.98 GCRY01000503.1:136-1158(+)